MSAGKAFFAELLRRKSPLLDAIVAFNTGLAGRLAPSALAPAAAPLAAFLAEGGRAGPFAHHLPLLVRGAEAGWTADFGVPRHRLALLAPPQLDKLALWYGLAAHRGEIAGIIERKRVLALREAVGEEGYTFAVRRSALLPAPPPRPAGSGPLSLRILTVGREAVAACLADAPDQVRFKLSRTLAPGSAALLARPAAVAPRAVWPLLRTLAEKEIVPAWQTCFM